MRRWTLPVMSWLTGLAGACRAEGEDHVVAGEGPHIVDLHRAAWHDGFLAGTDDHRRGILVAGDDAFERRLVGHHDERFDRAGVDLLTDQQALVQAAQDIGGAGHGILGAFDLHPVATGGDVDP